MPGGETKAMPSIKSNRSISRGEIAEHADNSSPLSLSLFFFFNPRLSPRTLSVLSILISYHNHVNIHELNFIEFFGVFIQ